MPSANQRIGEYILLNAIGRGRFGEVWKARHHFFEREFFAAKLPTEPNYVRNLQREGSVIHGLSHPCIVKAINFDPYADPPYLIMEYVAGLSLRQVLETARLKPSDAVHILLQILRALAYAHGKGVTHGDIKPENVLVREYCAATDLANEGVVKLTDFGLGRVFHDTRNSIRFSGDTVDGRLLAGTLNYMSPEQRNGREADSKSDLYSCGVVLFEMLTGSLPAGHDVPSDLNPAVPRYLDDAFRRAYARASSRFATATEFMEALVPPAKPAAAPQRPKSVVTLAAGIDLGTTAARIAVFQNGRPTWVRASDGTNETPAAIVLEDSGSIICGRSAAEKLSLGAAGLNDIPNQLRAARVKLRDATTMTQAIAASLLENLRASAAIQTGAEFCNSVVACPTAFFCSERARLEAAAITAGFGDVCVLTSGTAAVAFHAFSEGVAGTIAVCDLGANFFNVCIAEIDEGIVTILAHAGERFTGDDSFAKRVALRCVEELDRRHQINLDPQSLELRRVTAAVEDAQRNLIASNTARVRVPYLYRNREGQWRELDATIDRRGYESIVKDQIRRIEQCCSAAKLRAVGARRGNSGSIQHLFLVGRGPWLPNIEALVSQCLQCRPTRKTSPEVAVAYGAALCAAIRKGELRDRLVLDATCHSLTTGDEQDAPILLIPAGTPIPAKVVHVFTTTINNQAAVRIRIVEGEGNLRDGRCLLCELELNGIPPAPAGVPMLETTTTIDVNGKVEIKIRELSTGRSITFKTDEQSARSDVNQMIPTIPAHLRWRQLQT